MSAEERPTPTAEQFQRAEWYARGGNPDMVARLHALRAAAGLDLETGKPVRKRRKRTPSPFVGKLRLLNRFLDQSARQLTPAAALVWVVLWRDDRGGEVRTAVSDLARRCGLAKTTVKGVLADLRRAGFVERVRKGSPMGGPSVYRLAAKGDNPADS